MEWIGAAVLLTITSAITAMLVWVSVSHREHAGLWWCSAALLIACDGAVTLAQWPAVLVPFATDAVGPTAAWLFYRGTCDFARSEPRPIAGALAAAATALWFTLHFSGIDGWTFHASASAEIPLVGASIWLIARDAKTTMGRFFAASCVMPVVLVLLNPALKGWGISPEVSAQIWLASMTPLCIFATCVFLERGLAAKNRALEASAETLRQYRSQLEDQVAQRTSELEASQERLRQRERLASIGTLTAGVAHQVNNPVGSILAAADFAAQCRDDEDELEILRTAVDDINREAVRCGEIVRDMLRFASDRPTVKKLVPIDPILDRVRGSMGRLARERDARITLDLTGGPGALVFASPIEIEQALTNVVENALQSRARGAHVEIERRVEDDRVEIVIRDDGQGIPSGDLAHVLDPFFTSRLEAGGTGLGLSVAHGVAQDHGGTLSLESEPGRGTTVVLGFPRGDGR